ncbi:preprotein translocase subunit YajC [Nocardioides sambongensis]|uniref:preprotein translocase subunit YajC n=1 Tax=Nocardioides sambongensis TaxID=2589074 RepID=UPI001E337B96|nr:preprotein translocase subunit YajC [Nocardioides sambongensis]
MEEYASLLWIAAIAVIFWLLIIRPAQRRQKAMQQMQSGLDVGDRVLLTSGVFATIAEITDDDLAVEVAPGVVLRVVRGAIGSKVDRSDEAEESDDEDPLPEQGDD